VLTATNTATGVERATTTNDQGFFAFPSLPAGRYGFKVAREGFSPPRLTGLVVDAHSALRADATLTMIEKFEQVTVLANEVRVETSSTQAIEEVSGTAITALDGRSFTGLMTLGIVRMTIKEPESMVMARASVAIVTSADALGGLGTASRRSFHRPAMVKIAEARALGSARMLQPRSVSWTGDGPLGHW